MDYLEDNPTYGFKQRMYTNESMRNIKTYLDSKRFRSSAIDILAIRYLPTAPTLRTAREKTADENLYLEELDIWPT